MYAYALRPLLFFAGDTQLALNGIIAPDRDGGWNPGLFGHWKELLLEQALDQFLFPVLGLLLTESTG